MEINGKTKLHLNQTYYFDGDGDWCGDLQEARRRSYYNEDVQVVKKQNCYMCEYDELVSDDLKEQAQSLCQDPEHYIFIVNSKQSQIILWGEWDGFQKDLDSGIYTVVKKGE